MCVQDIFKGVKSCQVPTCYGLHFHLLPPSILQGKSCQKTSRGTLTRFDFSSFFTRYSLACIHSLSTHPVNPSCFSLFRTLLPRPGFIHFGIPPSRRTFIYRMSLHFLAVYTLAI